MDQRLKEYLEKRGATPLDPSVLENYATTMTKSVIPRIIEDMKQREQLAAERRFSPHAPSRLKKKGGG